MHTLAELIRSDTNITIESIDSVDQYLSRFEQIFAKIDHLVEVVADKKRALDKLETLVAKSERELLSKK